MNKLLVLSFLAAAPIAQASTPMDYDYVACTISHESGVDWGTMRPLMQVSTSTGPAKFIEILVVEKEYEVKYQLFIETSEQKADSVIVLQNFAVDQNEVSKEVTVKNAKSLKIQNGAWKAKCVVGKG